MWIATMEPISLIVLGIAIGHSVTVVVTVVAILASRRR
jgi:hypothetical protein